MTLDEMRRACQLAGIRIIGEKRLGNDSGTQLSLEGGGSISVYDKGSILVQGKNKEAIEEALGHKTPVVAETRPKYGPGPRKVFVVYGHNQRARDQLEAMLRRWGLEPLILDQLPTEGQTVIEKLESAISEAEFGVALATPDDVGYRVDHPDETAFRARQNVVLELGMLLARLGRRNVAILLQEQENMERPSDIQGLIYIPFRDDIARDAGVVLAKAMVAQGYSIDVARL